MSSVLFLTRSWHGHGVPQQWSRDVCAELGAVYGMRFHCEHPQKTGRWGMIVFVLRALKTGWQDGRAGWQIHLGDCGLLPLGVFLKMVTGARLSVTAFGVDVLYPAGWYQRMLRFCVSRCDRIVCISAATAREILLRGVPDERTVVIPCGIAQRGMMAPLSDVSGSMILSVGRLVPRKGIAWFLERVFPLLLQERPECTYTIVGVGPERERIANIIHREGLSRSVTLCGELSDAQRDVLLDHASVLVMPNVPVAGDMEGFGMACIEAASHGVPVAAARMEGIADAVIDGETGRLFAPGDVQDCLKMMRMTLTGLPDREMIAECAWGRFGWPVLIHQYQALVFDA